MKKIIRLNERELSRLVRRAIREQEEKDMDDEDMDDEDMDDEDIDDEDIDDNEKIEKAQETCNDLIEMLEDVLEDLKDICDSDDILELLPTKVASIEELSESLTEFIDGVESNAIGL